MSGSECIIFIFGCGNYFISADSGLREILYPEGSRVERSSLAI
jgi:hypothetical protein